jgi:hypothetical protein
MKIEDWGSGEYGLGETRVGTWWPTGEYAVPHSRLKQVLAQSARFNARQAIRFFVSDSRNGILQAAISVGGAVELLAKAYLASVAPALLAERGERDSVLVMANKAELAGRGVTDVKTIGAHEALLVAKHLRPALPYTPPADQIVLRVRNAAVHMGIVDRRELRAAVVVMCRIIETLLTVLGLDHSAFWGTEASSVVNEILDAAKSEVRRVVAAKMVAAKQHLAQLLSGLDQASMTVVIASLAGKHLSHTDHEEAATCPACGEQGWLLCGIERGELESWQGGDGEFYAFVFEDGLPGRI